MTNILERLDNQLSNLLSGWSLSTTLLALIIAAFVAYPIIYSIEPDTHPLLLARQSSVNPVRNKNESASYRSPETPHGYPLKTGLNVKDEGAARWSPGKDGDVRDIWRVARRGGDNGEKGLIMTVLGKEEIVEHDFEQLSKEIEAIGEHLKERGVERVAVYLPNSVEFLLTVFGMFDKSEKMWKAALISSSMFILWLNANSVTVQPTACEDLRTPRLHLSRQLNMLSWGNTTR